MESPSAKPCQTRTSSGATSRIATLGGRVECGAAKAGEAELRAWLGGHGAGVGGAGCGEGWRGGAQSCCGGGGVAARRRIRGGEVLVNGLTDLGKRRGPWRPHA